MFWIFNNFPEDPSVACMELGQRLLVFRYRQTAGYSLNSHDQDEQNNDGTGFFLIETPFGILGE